MHSNIQELVDANPNCCDNNKIAVENHMRFEIKSQENFIRLKIDSCLITSTQVEKCDFGFSRTVNSDFYFVELKGSEIEKAYNQIVSTVQYFDRNLLRIPKHHRFGFIVSSKVPKAGININNLKQDFAKKYGKVLEVKNKVLLHTPK